MTGSSAPFPLQAPTLDRPFGIELWPLFERAWLLVRSSPPQAFRFKPGVTPISTLHTTVALLVSYYVIIFGGRELMKLRSQPFQLNGLFKAHNLGLTIVSAVLLALFAEQLIPTVVRHGIFFSICNSLGGWTPQLVTLYYLNYITKYLELFDTLFLVLKKKPLTFLHTYHHGATALLCYTQLVGLTPISWVPITLNLMVHVVMYWYYFQSARGIRIWWKEWITRLQIIQFVIDLGFVYFATYTYFTSTYFPWLPNHGKCAGEEFAAIAGCLILSSYLLLFISFYIVTYNKGAKGGSASKGGAKRGRRNTATQATIDMARFEIPSAPIKDEAGASPKANGSANGSAHDSAAASGREGSARVTRSRKA